MDDVLAMVTSASWQCPVCNQTGAHHEPECFVLALAARVERLEEALRGLMAALIIDEDGNLIGGFDTWGSAWGDALDALSESRSGFACVCAETSSRNCPEHGQGDAGDEH